MKHLFIILLLSILLVGCTSTYLTLEEAVKASRDLKSNIDVLLEDEDNQVVIFQEISHGRLNVIINKYDYSNGLYSYNSNFEQGHQFEGEIDKGFNFFTGYLDPFGEEPMFWGTVNEPLNIVKIKVEMRNEEKKETLGAEIPVTNNVFFSYFHVEDFSEIEILNVYLISDKGEITQAKF